MRHKSAPTFSPLVQAIADRGVRLAASHGAAGGPHSFPSIALAVDHCDRHCRRLDLEGLLAADDGNFAHDVFGIVRYLDWGTGRLRDFFSPRFTARPAGYRPLTESEVESVVAPLSESPKGWEAIEAGAEWAGAPDPRDPDGAWIDDATGERVDAVTGAREPGNLRDMG